VTIVRCAQYVNRDKAQSVDRLVSFDIPPHGLSLDALEKQLVTQALEKSKNNKTKAAKLLGLTRGTFRYRLQKYGLAN
jgi:Response regulator containing CheY-like receiver, AAA-type ATPase, and DNA-binding domains